MTAALIAVYAFLAGMLTADGITVLQRRMERRLRSGSGPSEVRTHEAFCPDSLDERQAS